MTLEATMHPLGVHVRVAPFRVIQPAGYGKTYHAPAPFTPPLALEPPPDVTIGIRADEIQGIAQKKGVFLSITEAARIHRAFADDWQKTMIVASEKFWNNAIHTYRHRQYVGAEVEE